MNKDIVILGSTGSIGCSTLKCLKKDKSFKIKIFTTNKNINKIFKQAVLHNVKDIIIEMKNT